MRLRALEPGDYTFLRAMELGPELGVRWRFRGTTPAPDEWAQVLSQNVLCQFLVLNRPDDRPVGLVLAYKPSFQDQYAYIAATSFPGGRTPVVMLGLLLFTEYVFTCWSFRKLYLDTPEYNYPQFSSGEGKFFDVESRLTEHTYFDGRYWDQLTLAIRRDQWATSAAELLRAERVEHVRRVTIRLPEQTRTFR